MKYKIIVLVFFCFTIDLFANNAKEIFTQKCAICHTDKSIDNRIAPPARGLMLHLKENFKTDKEIISHINSFVLNPTREKAICKSIKKFGLMPSLKGSISRQELSMVSKWMVEHIKPKELGFFEGIYRNIME
jgi:cytochrome c